MRREQGSGKKVITKDCTRMESMGEDTRLTQGVDEKEGDQGVREQGQSTALNVVLSHTKSTIKWFEKVRKIKERFGTPVPETESTTQNLQII
jgi:hypothetical protein